MAETDLKAELGVVTEKDLADLRQVQVSHLRNERSRGEGPPFTRIGNRVFYPIKGIREYLAKQAITPARRPTLLDGQRKRSRERA